MSGESRFDLDATQLVDERIAEPTIRIRRRLRVARRHWREPNRRWGELQVDSHATTTHGRSSTPYSATGTPQALRSLGPSPRERTRVLPGRNGQEGDERGASEQRWMSAVCPTGAPPDDGHREGRERQPPGVRSSGGRRHLHSRPSATTPLSPTPTSPLSSIQSSARRSERARA